jgi:hypothetical protein
VPVLYNENRCFRLVLCHCSRRFLLISSVFNLRLGSSHLAVSQSIYLRRDFFSRLSFGSHANPPKKRDLIDLSSAIRALSDAGSCNAPQRHLWRGRRTTALRPCPALAATYSARRKVSREECRERPQHFRNTLSRNSVNVYDLTLSKRIRRFFRPFT